MAQKAQDPRRQKTKARSAKGRPSSRPRSGRSLPAKPKSGNKGAVVGRRDEIVQIAAKLFAERGFIATTIRDIADEAHIQSGSVFHHFDTKDEILHEVVRDAIALIRNKTLQIAKLDCDAELKVGALVLLDLDVHAKDHQAHSILYNERRFLRRKRGFEYVAFAKGDMFLAWRTVLQEGIDGGLFKRDLDIFLTLTTINRMLNTCADWLIQDRAFEDGGKLYELDEIIDFNLQFVMSAIRAPDRISLPIPRREFVKIIERLE